MRRLSAVLLAVLLPGCLPQLSRPSEVPSCHLPAGRAAVCVPFAACAHLASLVANIQSPLPRDVALLIRDSFICSGSGTSVEVCCPVDGLVTPSGARPQVTDRQGCSTQSGPAECVGVSSCSPFVQMLNNLKKPLHRDVPALVRSSYLCGAEQLEGGGVMPKVCCPSAALAAVQASHPYSSHPALPLLTPKTACGKASVNTRIVGGQAAAIGQFPWLVNLGYQRNGAGEPTFKCGGTLIGPRHALTAAHCVTQLPPGFELAVVRVGEHDLSAAQDCQAGICSPAPQDIEVGEVVFHPDYGSPHAFQNDIAVIRLARPVVESEFVAPVCLPFKDAGEDYLSPEPAELVDVAGWGATTETGRLPASVLQFLAVNVTDGEQCKEVYAERGGVLTDSQICAGGQKGKDSCVGDSGSGLMRNRLTTSQEGGLDRTELIGVVSFGPRLCGTEGVPGVYSRVEAFLPWILGVVAEE